MSSNRLTPEQKQEWLDRIEGWRSSNKSAASWCREKEIDYNKFLYWKGRFFPEATNLKTAFLELPEDKTNSSGIVIEYQDYRIQLSKQFDHSILRSLLIFLRKL